jgi:hypothetical protein
MTAAVSATAMAATAVTAATAHVSTAHVSTAHVTAAAEAASATVATATEAPTAAVEAATAAAEEAEATTEAKAATIEAWAVPAVRIEAATAELHLGHRAIDRSRQGCSTECRKRFCAASHCHAGNKRRGAEPHLQLDHAVVPFDPNGSGLECQAWPEVPLSFGKVRARQRDG